MIKKKITRFRFFMQILGICIIFVLVAKGLQSWVLKDYSYVANLLVSVFLSLICGVGHNVRVQDDDTGIREEKIIPVIGTKEVRIEDIDRIRGIPTEKEWRESLITDEIRPQNGESRRITTCTKLGVEVIHEPNKAL